MKRAVEIMNIFVLAWTVCCCCVEQTTAEELVQVASEYGTVQDVRLIVDKFTGRSKGYGFLTFGSAAEAEAAISGMASKELGGRQLHVNAVEPKPARFNRGGGGGFRSGGGRPGGFRNNNGFRRNNFNNNYDNGRFVRDSVNDGGDWNAHSADEDLGFQE